MAVDLVPASAALILACLCEAVNSAANPPAECCLRLPGDPVMDFSIYEDKCCSGLAYVAIGDMWPTGQGGFPNQDLIRQAAGCPPPSWAVEARLGVMRCKPVGTDTEPPTCAQYTVAAHQDWVDAQSLRRAACCAFHVLKTSPQMVGMGVVIGRMQSYAPQGGCSDRWLTVQFEVPADCDGC